jgi:uncharacterized membrane protein HdeD (DUF308 family)
VSRKLWVITLAIWLVLYGLFAITNLKVEAANLIMGILAIAAGILLVLDK